MNKEYYNQEKANYIIEKLASDTKVDKVYWPLIVDIILRRQYQFGLSDEIFKRDVQSFVSNVKRITVDTIDASGEFDSRNKCITISKDLFNANPINFMEIYEVLAHECCHAMNEEMNFGEKCDRAFPKKTILDSDYTGAMEMFTECEADLIAMNHIKDPNVFMMRTDTIGYPWTTMYFDIIPACFGVNKNDVLKAAIEGKKDLHRLLNEKISDSENMQEDNEFFNRIAFNIGLIHSEIYKDQTDNSQDAINRRKNNAKTANSYIYKHSEEVINKRIERIKASTIEEYRDEFETILRDQTIVMGVIENSFGFYQTEEERQELRNSIKNQFEIVVLKIKSIEYVLGSSEIDNKLDLLANIQKTSDLDSLNKILDENKIQTEGNMVINVSQKKADEHNNDYSSNGMTWDNSQVTEYIQDNIKKLAMPKHNKIEKIKKILNDKIFRLGIKLGNKLDVLISRIENIVNKRKLLQEGQTKVEDGNEQSDTIEQLGVDTPQDGKTNLASWNLELYGLSPRDVAYNVNPNSNPENGEILNDGLDIDDGGWDWDEKQ